MNQNKDNPDTESFKKIVALYLVLDLLQRSKAGSLLQESLLSPSSDENFVCWFVFLIFFFPESFFSCVLERSEYEKRAQSRS